MTPKVWRFAGAVLLCLLASGIPAQAAAPDCAAAVASAGGSNATALLAGSDACSQEGRLEDSSFLLLLGQIRSTADLTIFTPLDDQATRTAGELQIGVYYHYSGFGADELYRTPAKVDAFEARIRDAALGLTKDYDPGWSYRPSSKTDIYAAVLANAQEQRLWQMRSWALRLQDDAFNATYQALTKLRQDNPELQRGSPAYDEYTRLMAQIKEADARMPELPRPEDTVPYARLYEPDPEVAQQLVAMGFNGPAAQGAYVFRSEAEVRDSWLAAALSEQEIQTLLSRTDFSKQVLVGFSFGKRTNASAQVFMTELAYLKGGATYSIATRIGVVPDSCGVAFVPSYPFVVGVTEAVPGAEVHSQSTANFEAECGPIMSGQPTTKG